MKGKSLKKDLWMLEFQDKNHEVIYRTDLNHIVLCERFLIHQSIDKFGTNAPDIVYRTTILNDKIFECKEYIQELYQKGIRIIHKADVPDTVFDGMDGMEEYEYVKIYAKGKMRHEKKRVTIH